jgi:DNA-binding MarR family transcriptional regulator
MQPLPKATIFSEAPASVCAQQLLDALPPVMRFVRRHMRSHRNRALSVPQFRAMCLLSSAPAANLSAVADFLGASLPTTSRIVSGLVGKGLVERRECRGDRRQVELELTSRGAAVMKTAREATQAQLTEKLNGLDAGDRAAVERAMRVLHELFTPGLRSADGGECSKSPEAARFPDSG